MAQFELEKSSDGATFNVVDVIKSMGDGHHTYSYIDDKPFNGAETNIYYRIHAVGIAGASLYSNTVAIRNTNQENMLSIYPNPAGNFITVSSMAAQSVTIYDATGISVMKVSVKQGENILNLEELAPGVYILHSDLAKPLRFTKL